MNSQQKQKLIEIVKNDCQIRFYYINSKCETCVIGGMAIAIGITKQELKLLKEQNNYKGSSCGIHNPLADSIRYRLENEFGLELEQLCRLQEINDSQNNRLRRQQIILNYIETIPVID